MVEYSTRYQARDTCGHWLAGFERLRLIGLTITGRWYTRFAHSTRVPLVRSGHFRFVNFSKTFCTIVAAKISNLYCSSVQSRFSLSFVNSRMLTDCAGSPSFASFGSSDTSPVWSRMILQYSEHCNGQIDISILVLASWVEFWMVQVQHLVFLFLTFFLISSSPSGPSQKLPLSVLDLNMKVLDLLFWNFWYLPKSFERSVIVNYNCGSMFHLGNSEYKHSFLTYEFAYSSVPLIRYWLNKQILTTKADRWTREKKTRKGNERSLLLHLPKTISLLFVYLSSIALKPLFLFLSLCYIKSFTPIQTI